jgi:hypothetical protein
MDVTEIIIELLFTISSFKWMQIPSYKYINSNQYSRKLEGPGGTMS